MAKRTDKKSKIKIIYLYSLLEIIREGYLYVLCALFSLSIGGAYYLTGFSAVNGDISFVINLSALYYFSLQFWIIIAVPVIFSKEILNNYFLVIRSKPLSAFEYVFGKYLSYISVVFVYLLFAFIFSVLFGFSPAGALWYYGGVMLESMITVAAAVFFALNFKPVNAIIFTFMFFALSHSTYEIAKEAATEGKALLIGVSKVFYYLFPSYDYYDFSGVLVYGEKNSVKISFLAAYTLFYAAFILSLCLVTFKKEK